MAKLIILYIDILYIRYKETTICLLLTKYHP